jgi:hypothetical protein
MSLRCDQLITVNKVVNEKEQLEKGMEEEEEKKTKNKHYWAKVSRLSPNKTFSLPYEPAARVISWGENFFAETPAKS